MAKRILAFVLVLVLTMSMLPVSLVSADEISDVVAAVKASPKAGTHTDAGHAGDCGVTTGWLPWESDNSLPTSGNYYLTKNVTLTKEHNTIDGQLNLCLNGYVIKQTAKARVMSLKDMSGAKLTICDCTAYEENGTYYAGAVTGGNDQTASTGGGGIFVRKSTELQIYDGRFVGNRTQFAGGCILTQAAATVSGVKYPAGQVTIHNGEFSNNVAVKDTAYKSGGAIYISNGTTLTVHNGIFANNKGGDGGVFAVTTGAKLIIENGKFENNRSESNGGVINAILIGSATSTSAKMEIKNGTFTGNSAKTNGGILDMANGAQLTVTGGTFENNSAAYAGAFYLRANTVGISGATIQGNSSTDGGSAIYVYSTVKLTIGDGTVITKNTCSSKDDTDGMGAAICLGTSSADARVILTGKVYIAGNEIVSKKFGDLTFRRAANDTLRVNGLADGSCVVFSAPAAGEVTDPDDAANPIIKVEGTQDAWKPGWVAFKDANGVRNIDRDGTDFKFVTGHFHEGVEYLPLTSADQLLSGGAYYLAGDVTLDKAVALTGTTETSICLNSHKLTSTVTSEAAFSTKTNADAATFNIDDCTAYTDADGVYHAGAINGLQNKHTGHGGGAFMIRTNGTLNFYNGKITNCTAVVGGGAIFANGTVKMYGGELSGNQAVSGTAKKNGGAIYINYSSSNANNKGNLYAENVIFKGNDAPYAAGGAVYVSGPSEFKNCKFIDNNAGTTGGAIHIGNGNTTVEGCELTENSAVSASAINLSSSSAQLIIKDTTVTGNTASGYGAVNVIKGVKPVKLQGKVIITDNLNGTDQANFHVQNDNVTDALDATGLTTGSEIGVRLHPSRTVYTFSTASASNNKTYFTSDNDKYTVELDADNKLYLKETTVTPPPVVTHKHTLCSDTGCTEHTAEVTYEAWTDATKLPAEGNWYLDTDVTVSAEVNLKTATTLNLCLNGHTIKGYTGSQARAYSTTAKTATTINISDCTAKTVDGVYTAGKFTGFNNTHTNSGGSAIYIREGSHLNFFDGIVEKCNAASGGAIYVHTATANIYNGLITDNTAKAGETWKSGAGLFMYKATVNVENAQFTKNEGSYGAAIHFADGTCVLTLKDVKITDNKAQTAGGAINAAYTNSKLTISGNTVIEGNTVKGAANNVRLGDTGNIIVENLGANAKIGVTVGGIRAFSNVVGTDLSAQFPNDDSAYITYLDADGKLAQKSAFEHIHCVCGKADCTDASHEKIEYAAWTSTTTLPKSGNYCLTADVTITAEASLAKNTTLNLCLHGHKVTGKGGRGVRFFSTSGNGGEVLNITDCTATFDASGKYIAGGFYGNDNTHDNSGGGAIYIRAGGLLNFYQGIVSGNKSATGGAAFYGKNATLNIFYAEVTDNQSYDTVKNVWKDGAALYSDNSVITVYDGVFTGNQAKSGGVYSGFGTGVLDIRGGTFTGNVAQETFGGFNAATSTLDVKISGDVTIFGNTAAGKASNLRLAGNKADVADLADTAKISVTANPFAAFTTETQDYTKQFVSDDAKLDVVYQENKLFLIASTSEHMHCLCAGTSTKGCDHGKLPFLAWDKATSLPTGGNYYLTTDVTISTQTRLENTDLNLCLNGHTITVTTGRAFYMTDGANLVLTDCQGSGKITGATAGAILSNAAGKDMEINLYAGTFTENHANSSGGALVVQGDCVFNMYGGKITGNTATSKLNTNADGSVKLDSAGNQSYTGANGGGVYVSADSTFNMYAGEISNNTATSVEYLKFEATTPTIAGGYAGAVAVYGKMNLYGGKLIDNNGFHGGAIFVSSAGSELNIYGGEISGNTAQNAGGAIISQTHAVTNISGGKITKNTALKGGGGGMYVSTGTTLNMTGGEITYNVSADPKKDHNGGGLYVLASTVNMSGGVIGYNKAAGGAGMYMGLSGERFPTVNISGTAKITGNEASGNGGGIFATGEGTKITMTGGEISKNKAANGGGLITQTKSAFEFTGGKIVNNKVTASGGGIYISTNTTLKMTGGSISGNVSKGTGGGAAILRAKATITGGSISSNTASNGAGLKIMGATVTIGGASVTNNHSIGTLNKTTGKYTGANGAGIYIGRAGYKKNGVQLYDYPVVTVSGAYVAYNKADGAGAGMLVESNGTKFTMYSGTFAYNEAPNSSGGAIYFSNYSNPNIYGAKIYGNKAKSAAAIYSANNKGVMENLVIYDNEGSSSTVIITGADSVFEAKNIEIYDNVSTGAVGGIAIQGKATFNLENAKIHNNVCKSGGGGVYFSTPGYGTWKNVEIYENESTNNSGGVFVGQSSWVTFENVTIRDNVAGTGFGGGLFCRGRLDMINCKILNNEIKEGVGGGVATSTMSHVDMGQDAGVYAENCVISGNKAAEQGGGVYGHRGGPVYLHTCTVTDNTSGMEGGGVYANGRFGLVNSTVTGNTSGGEGFAVYFTAGEFDGHSYSTGHKKVGGDMIIKDNNGGDMYLGEGSAVAVVEGPLGEKTCMNIVLHSGVLSEHLFGEYDYEGGDLVYVVTAGNRSLTDPETYVSYQPADADEEEGRKIVGSSDILLYAGIAIIALAVIGAAVLVVLKKKKAGKTAEKANKE